ncbi:hypothetical protein [Croceicoccus gelatinilyticus]|uniref:hypothetical protein n=1 Tax=Croceicoccus gelatinilyticus TaxID=2835536 RepID=UPI001BCAC258|nr:hypothetical protein [Croceicoccus gelatinilyticus]MBS7671297.1 hypothetical protein [Croceicoccus gelatinilyticus]
MNDRASDHRKDIEEHLARARGPFTIEEIEAGFDAVKNAEHWKGPIDAIIDEDQKDLIGRAIPWFTGTPAEFFQTDQAGKLRVVAAGYWNGPCN